MRKSLFMPYNLQFFAEPDTGVGGNNNGEGDGAGTGNEGANGAEQKPMSFDDFLKLGDNQSIFDKRLGKALETSKAKWQAEYDQKIEEAKTEAAKLAKMNAEEKAEYEKKQKEADYEKRLAALNERELKAEAKDTLASEGLPLELAEVLNYTNAETCKASIDAMKKAFQSAVEKAVDVKLRGTGAPRGTNGNNGNNLQDTIAKAMRGQI